MRRGKGVSRELTEDEKRETLLTVLRLQRSLPRGKAVSGPMLGEELNLTRAAAHKRLVALESQGYLKPKTEVKRVGWSFTTKGRMLMGSDD